MRLYGEWEVTLPDEKYTFQPDEMLASEQLAVENEFNGAFTFDGWMQGIDNRAVEACQVLIWFLRRKAGQQVDRYAVDFPIRKLDLTKINEVDDDPEASAGSEPATSPTSPSVTESDPGSGTA